MLDVGFRIPIMGKSVGGMVRYIYVFVYLYIYIYIYPIYSKHCGLLARVPDVDLLGLGGWWGG